MNGKIVDDDKKTAKSFNNIFVNFGPTTENTIPKVPNKTPSRLLKNHNQINFVIAHVSNEEILDIINSVENKSTGPTSPLKLTSDTRYDHYAYIINMSLLTDEYPDLLKLVKVIPIHKGGSTQ